MRQVESLRGPGGYRLRIEGAGEWEVGGDGGHIARLPPGPIDDAEVEALVGPCLVLALALQGVWCLHAAAMEAEGMGCVAFAGGSGAGKSTLARCLDGEGGWRRMADDLLPLRLAGEGAEALPRFPQLKLPADQQWSPPAAEAVPLRAVYLLEPAPVVAETCGLAPRRAALALVGQTVAARLYDRALQGAHLDLCAELARRLPVRRLRLPRLPAGLAAVSELLRAEIAGRPGART